MRKHGRELCQHKDHKLGIQNLLVCLIESIKDKVDFQESAPIEALSLIESSVEKVE